jgi:hypothetical protein
MIGIKIILTFVGGSALGTGLLWVLYQAARGYRANVSTD